MNLMLALLWLSLALMLYALHLYDPNSAAGRITAIGVPLYWVAAALGVYNVIRWILLRDKARTRFKGARERFESLHRRHVEPRERNPDFIFDDPPPSEHVQERPRGD